jgi:hypothetical protein
MDPDDAPIGSPPDFGANVLIFDPNMSMQSIQSQVDGVKDKQGEFSTGRYALLFKPGQYQVDVRVGYYTQMLGLGASPDDVAITGAVRSKPELGGSNATTTFWKAVENFSVTPTQDANIEVWAVAQGTSFRRAHVKGTMHLSDGGWSSGGFIADTKIDASIDSGSQQQFFTRNTDLTKWQGGSYNMVFVGDLAAPKGTWPASPYSVADSTPVVREKPYLYIDKDGNYFVRAPYLKKASQGPSWVGGAKPSGRGVTTGRFYVAKPGTDTAATLNGALDQGKHLLFTPGIYHLSASLDVKTKDTIVMGLGLATLIPDQGTPAITVSDVDGVKIAGLLLQAGKTNSDSLLVMGAAGSTQRHDGNPSAIYDLSCRIGGGDPGVATTCVTVNSNDVIGDNLWLWRADHGAGTGWTSNKSLHGLIVNGQNVTMYGLFAEHFQDYQTLWNANGGQLFFYQSELPYDPPNQQAWQHDGVNGFASYKVAPMVTTHSALGLGMYAVLRQPVVEDSAIEAPEVPGVQVHHMVTTTFGGDVGKITHIFNATGMTVDPSHTRAFSDN